MIEFDTNEYGTLTFSDDYPYDKNQYKALVGVITEMWFPENIKSIRATEKHLREICATFLNISRPHIIPNRKIGYVWIGQEAQTIFANIQLALQHNITEVIATVDDYDFTKGRK